MVNKIRPFSRNKKKEKKKTKKKNKLNKINHKIKRKILKYKKNSYFKKIKLTFI